MDSNTSEVARCEMLPFRYPRNAATSERAFLQSIQSKSNDLQNFLASWKESTLHTASFDLTQALQEKAAKMQSEMNKNVKEKESAIESLKLALEAAQLRRKAAEDQCVALTAEQTRKQQEAKMARTNAETELAAKKAELAKCETELAAAKEAAEKKSEKLRAAIEEEKERVAEINEETEKLGRIARGLEEYRERRKDECVRFFAEAVRPLEKTREEIRQQKKMLEERIRMVEGLILQTSEEGDMLTEDYRGHTVQREEVVAQSEELDVLADYLGSQSNPAADFEREYYVELLQKLFEERFGVLGLAPSSEAEAAATRIVEGKLGAEEVETQLGVVYKALGLEPNVEKLRTRKQYYMKLRAEIAKTNSSELQAASAELSRLESVLKDNSNYTENNITPALNAVAPTLLEYNSKSAMMKRQLSTLLQAEEEAETQIRGLDTKRKQRVESLSADPELAGQMAEADKTGSQLGEEKARAQANIAAHDAELQGLEKEVISKSESAEGRAKELQSAITELERRLASISPSETEGPKTVQEDLALKREKAEKEISTLESKLEDALQSYKCAVEAGMLAQRLDGSKSVASIAAAREDEDEVCVSVGDCHNRSVSLDCAAKRQAAEAVQPPERLREEVEEIAFPEVVCLPLQGPRQNSSMKSQVAEPEPDRRTEELESEAPSVPSSLTRCSSRTGAHKTAEFPPSENKENLDGRETLSKYQRYLSNGCSSRPKSRAEKTHQGEMARTEVGPVREDCDEKVKEWANRLWCTRTSRPDEGDSAAPSVVSCSCSVSFAAEQPAKCSPEDLRLLAVLRPLVKGHDFYKKFCTKYTSKSPAFDPLKAKINPPANCGYGLRHFRLSEDFCSIVITATQSLGSDFRIPVECVVRPVVPQRTIDIIKAQKATRTTKAGDKEGMVAKIASAMLDREGKRGSCAAAEEDCGYYPFSFELTEKGRLDLIATDYQSLKLWVVGVSALSKNRKLAERLAKYRS